MASPFASIPVRSNGPPVQAAWFNAIRSALISAFGSAFLGETSFTIVNNQSSVADVTGLLFDSSTAKSAIVEYRIRRKTTGGGATELVEAGTMIALYNTSGWDFGHALRVGDDAGITFSITAGGQFQYTSSNITGSPSISEMRFKASTLG